MMIRMMADYEGAGHGRRLSSWGTSNMGPTSSLFGAIQTLRARARELSRNDPSISGALDTLTAQIIGTGVSPLWKLDDIKIKRAIHALWSDWVQEADFDGMLDFYGLQTLICRELIEVGECLVRFVTTRDNETVPLRLQVLEADHLDASFNSVLPNGNEIRMGIEFDRNGKRAAYWLFKEHPGETFGFHNGFERIRIPADQLLHIMQPKRAGQKRGASRLAAAVVTAHELNQFDDAELVRKKTAAMIGGFLKQPSEEYGMPSVLGGYGGKDESGSPVVEMEPGTFLSLKNSFDGRNGACLRRWVCPMKNSPMTTSS